MTRWARAPADIVIFNFVSDNSEVYDRRNTVGLLRIESITHLDASVA